MQADGYYPHVITIDAGDTVTWALNTVQLVGVSFAGTCADISSSCAPQDCLTIFREDFQDFSPCGPSRYDGVTGLAQSGMMVSPVYSNWDTSIPHGATTYSLTFTRPGVNIYFDQSVTGMRGVVVVHPAGTRTRSPRRSTPPRRNNSCKPTSRRGPRHAGTPSR